MDAIIITLLILLVFLLSCDNTFLQKAKDAVMSFSSTTTVTPEPVLSPFSADDNYTITEDPLYPTAEGFLGSREEVNTWEPSTADFSKLGNDKIYKVYAEDLKANVDRAIVESHREYTADSDFLATTGASHASARDDFQPAVPFHGLPRAAHYANVGSERTARVSQSETPEEVKNITQHNGNTYTL